MPVAIRPVIGFSGACYAILDEATDILGGTPTYGAVFPLPNSVEMTFDPGASITTLFTDDGASHSAETVGEMPVTLNLGDILPEDVARLFGHTYTSGNIQRKTSDVSPYIAIGGRILRSGKDGANAVYEYFWINKVILQKPVDSGKTKGASVEFQTKAIAGRAVKLTCNDSYKNSIRSDDVNVPAATLAGYLNQPVISGAVDLGALAAVISVVALTTSFVITKAGGGLITLTQSNLNTLTMPIFKAGALQAGTYVITNNGTATVTVIFTPSVAYGTASVSASVVANGVKDQNGVFVTQKNAILSY